MICDHCHGNHYIVKRDGKTEPCPMCIGGIAHCCDGDAVSEFEEMTMAFEDRAWAEVMQPKKQASSFRPFEDDF